MVVTVGEERVVAAKVGVQVVGLVAAGLAVVLEVGWAAAAMGVEVRVEGRSAFHSQCNQCRNRKMM